MLSVLAWLTGSKVGRYIALGLLAVSVVGVVLLRVYVTGKRDEQLKQAQSSLNAVRNKVKSDEAIRRLSASERRRKLLDEWSR